jgi:hypothetical protein
MDNASNWEFAASIAAVCIGLSGLLLFTLIATIGGWRVLARASRAAEETAKSTMVVQDLARQLAMREASQPVVDVSQAASQLAGLRVQADSLLQQQTRLQEAVRNLVEAGVLRGESSSTELRELEAAVRRLEEHLARMAAAVASLSQR